ncbi:MAG: tetratricopeptide repeat protein [Thalassobaculales bacterium]
MLLLAVLLAGMTAAKADQNDRRLPELFARLKQAPDAQAAAPIAAQIWQAWMAGADEAQNLLMRMGVSAMQRDDLKAALLHFNALVRQAPNFAEAWNKRATVHFLMGDDDASVADIYRTLELEPRHFGALSGLAGIFLKYDRLEGALRTYEKALSIHPHLEGAEEQVKALRLKVYGSPT